MATTSFPIRSDTSRLRRKPAMLFRSIRTALRVHCEGFTPSTVPAAVDTMGRRVAPRQFRTIEEKARIIAETRAPGVSVAEVARCHEVNANQVFAWRRLATKGCFGRVRTTER